MTTLVFPSATAWARLIAWRCRCLFGLLWRLLWVGPAKETHPVIDCLFDLPQAKPSIASRRVCRNVPHEARHYCKAASLPRRKPEYDAPDQCSDGAHAYEKHRARRTAVKRRFHSATRDREDRIRLVSLDFWRLTLAFSGE
jgi:hypothetical protein